jgi:hypothetical protein
MKRYILGLLFISFFIFSAGSVLAAVQHYEYNGRDYYIVDGNNPNLNSGNRVCTSVGKTCYGYTDLDTNVCKYFHPSASVIQSYNGSKSGFYCNGTPQTGLACAPYKNNCQVCPACNVNADCNFQIGGLFREMYVDCGPSATPAQVVTKTLVQTKTVVIPVVSKGGWLQSFISYLHNLWALIFHTSTITVTTTTVVKPATPAPTSAVVPSFKACFVNSGSIASMGPCFGPVGTNIVIQVSRQLKQPLAKIVFKPYSVTGIPGATGAEVIVSLSGAGTMPQSQYTISAPAQLCLGGGGSWDAWPIDASGQAQGDIGRFSITGCK